MSRRSIAGSSLVELLAGLVVGLVVAIVVLDVLTATEARRRNVAGIAEAQQTGALMVSTLAAEIANGGAGLAAAASVLGTCADSGDLRTTLRPIAVLITSGATPGASDAIAVNYARPSALATPLPLVAAASAGASLAVRAPTGFAVGDAIVVATRDGRCTATTVTAVSPPEADGTVLLARDDAADTWPASAQLVPLGPKGAAERVRFDVGDSVLRSLDLANPAAIPNPLASNVVLLKAQYGIDADGDGYLDSWVGADAAPWTPADVLAAPAATLARIKALRLGVVVRSDAWDRDLVAGYDWVLFDCGAPAPARCPGRLAGTLPAHWRYRTYETVVPLRNAIAGARP